MKTLRADELQPRMTIRFKCANGETMAKVQGIEHATERDLVAPDDGHLYPNWPVIGLHLQLMQPIVVPAVPHWRAALITYWAAPDEQFERYV